MWAGHTPAWCGVGAAGCLLQDSCACISYVPEACNSWNKGFFVLRQGLAMQLWLAWNCYVDQAGLPQMHRDLPVSASQALGLK